MSKTTEVEKLGWRVNEWAAAVGISRATDWSACRQVGQSARSFDIDVKRPEALGYDTLDELGFGILPDTPMAHTASSGLHLYFRPPADREIRNTGGARGRGIGPGLDWRGEGGYVIVPSPGSGYDWDPIWNFQTAGLAEARSALLPREVERLPCAEPVRPTIGLSPYGRGRARQRLPAHHCGPGRRTGDREFLS